MVALVRVLVPSDLAMGKPHARLRALRRAPSAKAQRHASLSNASPVMPDARPVDPPRGAPLRLVRDPTFTNTPTSREPTIDLPEDLQLLDFIRDGPLKGPVVPVQHQKKLKDLDSLMDWRLRAPSQTGQPYPWQVKRVHSKGKAIKQDEGPEGVNSVRHYAKHHLKLIQFEREAKIKEAQRRLAVRSPTPDESTILFDVTLARGNRHLGQRTATKEGWPIFRCKSLESGEALPSHNFKVGMTVLISALPHPPNAKLDEIPYVEGQVLFVSTQFLELVLDPVSLKTNPISLHKCRVDEAFDDLFGGAIEAVESLKLDREAQKREQQLYDSKSEYEQGATRLSLIQSGTDLRDLIVPAVTSGASVASNVKSVLFKENQLLDSWIQRHLFTPPLAVPGDPDLSSFLNAQQIQAIAMALDNRLFLIQGPPGTGKTQTITGVILLLKHYFQTTIPILVCAPNHAAVDHLTASMANRGLRPLRVGRYERIREDCKAFSYDMREEQHFLAPTLSDHRFERSRSKEYLENNSINVEQVSSKQQSVKKQAEKLKMPTEQVAALEKAWKRYVFNSARVREVSAAMRADIFSSADVVLSTVMGSHNRVLDFSDWPIVLIDEAAQCNESNSLIPLKRGCEQAILIGDHKQLQSSCISPAAEQEGYICSLFERLIETPGIPSIMLREQYRMAPDIVAFPNEAFYHNRLVTGQAKVEASQADPIKSAFLKPGRHLSFVNQTHPESSASKSRQNHGEMEITASIIEDLFAKNPGLQATDIGVITPYAAQTQYLRDLQRYLSGSLSDIHKLDGIMVNTVDSFQGQERKVIILSTVRSNTFQGIGFLENPRRLNVALTRAQKALFVIGNEETLAGDKRSGEDVWQKFMRFLSKHNLITEAKFKTV